MQKQQIRKLVPMPPPPHAKAMLEEIASRMQARIAARHAGKVHPRGKIGVGTRAKDAIQAIGQNLLGRNQRPADDCARIWAMCKECDERTSVDLKVGAISFCRACSCVLREKIRNAGTECPAGKWGKWTN